MTPLRLLLLLTLSIFSAQSLAQSLYISDELYVPVRKGQGNQFSILHKGLPSGTRVTLIQREKEWTKVKTSGGVTGWIRNQFLSKTPPAKLRLSNLQKKVEELTANAEQLQAEKTELEQRFTQSQQELQGATATIQQTKTELVDLKSISDSAVKNYDRLQELTSQMQLLQTENDVLRAENEQLENNERTTFFFYGAIAVLLGVLIAVIVPKLRRSKRNNGWAN